MIGCDINRTLDRAHREALETALSFLVDELLEDLVDLRGGVHPSKTRAADKLPCPFKGRYDEYFLRMFIVCVLVVAWKLHSPGDECLASVAEELALSVLLDEARGVLEGFEIKADFSTLETLAYEDMDFEWLYCPEVDGVENTFAARFMGMANLGFSDWFKPFRREEPVHPYVSVS